MPSTIDSQTANEVIGELLDALGVESFEAMSLGEAYRVELGEHMDDLQVEKESPQCLSIGHYFKQRGDMMPDPLLKFEPEEDGDEVRYIPIEVQQPKPLGVGVQIERDPDGLDGVLDFVNMFATNLRNHGYINEATPEDKIEF